MPSRANRIDAVPFSSVMPVPICVAPAASAKTVIVAPGSASPSASPDLRFTVKLTVWCVMSNGRFCVPPPSAPTPTSMS